MACKKYGFPRTYSGELIAVIKAPGYTEGSSLSCTFASFIASDSAEQPL